MMIPRANKLRASKLWAYQLSKTNTLIKPNYCDYGTIAPEPHFRRLLQAVPKFMRYSLRMITHNPPVVITRSGQTSMTMTQKQIHHLKSLAHALKPVVRVGQNGVSASLLHELDVSLTRHELLKVKITGADRSARDEAINALCADSGAQCIQSIGSIAVLFRRNKKSPVISLPA